MTAPEPLAGGFAAGTETDWRTAASRSSLSSNRDFIALSDDGIPIGPVYRRIAGATPIVGRAPGQTWRIVQRVDAAQAAAAVSMAREELAGGADGFALVFADSIHPLRSAMPADAAPAIAAGLGKSAADRAVLMVDAGPRTPEVARAFLGGTAECTLAFDPIAALARGQRIDVKATAAQLASLAEAFKGTLALADGRLWHAAGASEVQELAAVLATVIAQLRLFETAGLAPDDVAARIGVALAADTDQFLVIAKVRAMRLLLARALEAAGIAALLPIHAETAWRMMSRREPRMNVLRATGAAFSAAVAGADSITVLPFDALDDRPSAEARRLARNTQLVISEESQLYRFADPAAGSGAVETLTDALAERAWERFRAIEAAGGMLQALAAGSLQSEIAATREARLARISDGAIEMIGVNAFIAATDESPLATAEQQESVDGALAFKRLAEAIEAAQ